MASWKFRYWEWLPEDNGSWSRKQERIELFEMEKINKIMADNKAAIITRHWDSRGVRLIKIISPVFQDDINGYLKDIKCKPYSYGQCIPVEDVEETLQDYWNDYLKQPLKKIANIEDAKAVTKQRLEKFLRK